MNKQIAALVVLVLLLAAILFVSGGGFKSAQAVNSHNMTGWAWSSNVGWISLNCNALGSGQDPNGDSTCEVGPDYGVTINTLQTPSPMSGYAWSSIGWISFNSSELTGCPDGICLAQLDAVNNGERKMSGWARACAVFVSGCSGALKTDGSLGGWAGFISLSPKIGDTVTYSPLPNCRLPAFSGCYGVRMDTTGPNANTFSGYAWGDEVLGWINFAPTSASGVALADPVALQNGVTATVNATPVTNGATTITWNSAGTTGPSPCVLTSTPATTGWDNATAATTGSVNLSPTVSTTFTAVCTGNSSLSAPASAVVNPPVITAFSSNTSPAQPNASVTLSWTEAGGVAPIACTRSAGWSGSGGASGSLAATVGATDTTFGLQCADAGGQTTALSNLIVPVLSPQFTVNISATPQLISFVSDKQEVASTKTVVSLSSVSGFATPVTLSLLNTPVTCASGAAGSVSAHFGNRTTGSATAQIGSPYSGTQDLYVAFSCDVGAGQRTVTLRAQGGTKTVDTPVSINVQSFKPIFKEQ